MSAGSVLLGDVLKPIPRYVVNLNAAAERIGISVTTEITPYDNDPELRLWSKWRCTKEQLQAYGLVGSVIARKLTFMVRRVELSWPQTSKNRHEQAVLYGEIESLGERLCWIIDSAPGLYELEQRDDIEIVRHNGGSIWHGSLEALTHAGIDRHWFPVGKLTLKASRTLGADRAWSMRRQPDGLFVCHIEGDAQRAERFSGYKQYGLFPELLQRPAYLRLVVDNTRPEVQS